MLARVDVTRDAYGCMLSHALSTESEEIMGLLCGDTHYEGGELVCTVWSAAPQNRSDRRRDRVETTPEQLASSSQAAELASAATGTTTRVIGWYHSHPHITVLPSSVDVRTQGTYQLLDEGFVGLIFSVFDQDREKVGRMQAVAFQAEETSVAADSGAYNAWGMQASRAAAAPSAHGGGFKHRLVPMRIVPSQQCAAWPHRLAPLLELQRTLLAEEEKTFTEARAAAAALAAGTSGAAVAGAAAAAMHQCHICALLSHSLAPLLCAMSGRVAQSRVQVEQLADDMQTTMADDMPDAAAAADFHPSADAADDILAL